MEELSIPLKLILAFVLGGVIGLEREMQSKKDDAPRTQAILGIRTFSLVTGLGALTALLHKELLPLAVIIAGMFAVLLIVFYYFDSRNSKDIGITTEIALVYSFLIGVIIAIDLFPIQLTLALTVVLLLILSRKEKIKGFVQDISKREMHAFISYAIIAVVILPFLPNHTYALSDIPTLEGFLRVFGIDIQRMRQIELINPYNMWRIVALITGIDMAGYVLQRFIGAKRGVLLSSFVAGFVSSTATTIALARDSKRGKQINYHVAACLLSNLASFFQLGLLVAPLNARLFVAFLPYLSVLIIITTIVSGYFLLRKDKKSRQEKTYKQKDAEIFSLSTALKFTFLFLAVSLVSKIALEFFGEGGFLTASAIAAATGLDAVSINTASLSGRNISLSLGVLTLALANTVNLLSKVTYAFLYGNRVFALKLGISMIVILGVSALTLLF